VFTAHMASIKVAATLLIIFLFVPLLVRLFPPQKMPVTPGKKQRVIFPAATFSQNPLMVAVDYFYALKYIIFMTVPLMLVAGFVGALVMELGLERSIFDPQIPTWIKIIGVAFVGTLLPVPMLVDVILTEALVFSGVSAGVGATLLVSLGSYSVYSFFIVWQTLSKRIALGMFFAVFVVSSAAGFVEQFIADQEAKDDSTLLGEYLAADATKVTYLPEPDEPRHPWKDISNPQTDTTLFNSDTLKVVAYPHAPREEGAKGFERLTGKSVGLRYDTPFMPLDFVDPHVHARGLASADLNGDGWVDVLVATRSGVRVYQNLGGRFQATVTAQEQTKGMDVFAVAAADFDADGDVDIYLTTHFGPDYILYSPLSAEATLVELPTLFEHRGLTYAPGFYDFNQDGYLDIVNGKWLIGDLSTADPLPTMLYISNGKRGWVVANLGNETPETIGETQAMLVSDINGDGMPDVLTGNDYAPSDLIAISGLKNAFERITESTMSHDSADIDNDGDLDVYTAQIAISPDEGSLMASPIQKRLRDVRERCGLLPDDSRCVRQLAMRNALLKRTLEGTRYCGTFKSPLDRQQCAIAVLLNKLSSKSATDTVEACERIPNKYQTHKRMCAEMFRPGAGHVMPNNQVKARNTLHIQQPDGTFKDRAEELGVRYGSWAWNSKFADVDNDGWQDLFIANGSFVQGAKFRTNIMYHNKRGQGFEAVERAWGLWDDEHTSASLFIDIDNDGDLDIITNTADGPLKLFKNRMGLEHALTVEIKNSKGNPECVGCKLTVTTRDGQQYLREIKLSGGFLSFDAPIVHIGLGAAEVVGSLSIRWADGSVETLTEPVNANQHLVISRK